MRRVKLQKCLPVIAACTWAVSAVLPIEALGADPSGITIVSPANGAVVRPGASITVQIQLESTISARRVTVLAPMKGDLYALSAEDLSPPYNLTLEVPREFTGPLEIVSMVEPNQGAVMVGQSLTLNVVPSDSPIAIRATKSGDLILGVPNSALPPRVIVAGTYADGTVRDLSREDLGTTFVSTDPSVATIDENGILTAHASGRTAVSVSNSGLSAFVPVVVRLENGGSGPAKDVTSQVTISRSGFRHDISTDMYVQQVTMKNIGTTPILFPVDLVITNLPAGVELNNAVRKTRVIAPIGSPRARVTAQSKSKLIAPGDTVISTLVFSNPGESQITYTLRLFSGPGL